LRLVASAFGRSVMKSAMAGDRKNALDGVREAVSIVSVLLWIVGVLLSGVGSGMLVGLLREAEKLGNLDLLHQFQDADGRVNFGIPT
jgi:hypothetical protein